MQMCSRWATWSATWWKLFSVTSVNGSNMWYFLSTFLTAEIFHFMCLHKSIIYIFITLRPFNVDIPAETQSTVACLHWVCFYFYFLDSRAGEGAPRTVDHAVIGGVVAVVVFAMLCLLIVLGRYFARHKGRVYWKEVKCIQSALRCFSVDSVCWLIPCHSVHHP